jgi:hypothetical protein
MARAVALLLALAALAVGGSDARSTTVPADVLDAVHGRVAGWARSGPFWFVVHLDRRGGGWCGLEGARWRMALVRSTAQVVAVADDRDLGPAMCGNELLWVRAGRFSDGRDPEVALALRTTPSVGATARIERIAGGRLHELATFHGDAFLLGRGSVTVRFDNTARSPRGHLEERYRFDGKRYRLVTGR